MKVRKGNETERNAGHPARAPAHWRQRLARETERLYRLRRIASWPRPMLHPTLRLRSGPLSGHTLAALVEAAAGGTPTRVSSPLRDRHHRSDGPLPKKLHRRTPVPFANNETKPKPAGRKSGRPAPLELRPSISPTLLQRFASGALRRKAPEEPAFPGQSTPRNPAKISRKSFAVTAPFPEAWYRRLAIRAAHTLYKEATNSGLDVTTGSPSAPSIPMESKTTGARGTPFPVDRHLRTPPNGPRIDSLRLRRLQESGLAGTAARRAPSPPPSPPEGREAKDALLPGPHRTRHRDFAPKTGYPLHPSQQTPQRSPSRTRFWVAGEPPRGRGPQTATERTENGAVSGPPSPPPWTARHYPPWAPTADTAHRGAEPPEAGTAARVAWSPDENHSTKPDPLDLAETLKRILDEEARRHGIDI